MRLSIERLFYWAAFSDKYGGQVQETPLYGATVAIHEPVGVIGIACPDEFPLLGFISLVMPAVVRGNAVVVVPSEKHPLCAKAKHNATAAQPAALNLDGVAAVLRMKSTCRSSGIIFTSTGSTVTAT